MERSLRIYAKEKKIMKDGRTNKFMTYSYTKDGNKFYQVKFAGTSKPEIREAGYYLVKVDDENLNIKHTRVTPEMIEKGFIPNDILWVKDVISCTRDVDHEQKIATEKLAELLSIL